MNTIFAPITAVLKSSTIVIRISGPKALAVLDRFDIKATPVDRKVTLVHLKDGPDLIDQALFTYYKGPKSYTGENVVELALHGSIAIYKRIIKILAELTGFRMAEPGEFTKRAFLNNKIDLLQAEAIDDLLKSETSKQAELALRQLSGKISDYFNDIREELIKTRAFVEAYIDFPDEEIPEHKVDEAENLLDNVKQNLEKRLSEHKLGAALKEGINISIIGPVNSGKSSLINYLSKREVAIVSNIPGTTRDALEAHLEIGGYPVTLIDTAGFRETEDEIEKMGIEKSSQKAAQSDFKILLLPANDANQYTNYKSFIDDNTVVALNKVDLKKDAVSFPAIEMSIKNEQGIDKLIEKISTLILNNYNSDSDIYITRERHKRLIERVLNEIDQVDFSDDLVIVGEHLRRATELLGQITGVIDIEDILDKIFSSFCIGK